MTSQNTKRPLKRRFDKRHLNRRLTNIRMFKFITKLFSKFLLNALLDQNRCQAHPPLSVKKNQRDFS
jgi:hypothetical protein